MPILKRKSKKSRNDDYGRDEYSDYGYDDYQSDPIHNGVELTDNHKEINEHKSNQRKSFILGCIIGILFAIISLTLILFAFSNDWITSDWINIDLGFLSMGIDRTDPYAIAEALFENIMLKNYQGVIDIMESGGRAPKKKEWNEGIFIMEDENLGFKDRWIRGSITGYEIRGIYFHEYGSIIPQPNKRMVEIIFVLNGTEFTAIITLDRWGQEWIPIWTTWMFAGESLIYFGVPE